MVRSTFIQHSYSYAKVDLSVIPDVLCDLQSW